MRNLSMDTCHLQVPPCQEASQEELSLEACGARPFEEHWEVKLEDSKLETSFHRVDKKDSAALGEVSIEEGHHFHPQSSSQVVASTDSIEEDQVALGYKLVVQD